MLQNYFKLALRNLLKNKLFSSINLLGLTAGTIGCLYIVLYVRDQRSYDRCFQASDNLYRLITTLDLPGESEQMRMATCSPPIAPTMQAEFPEVEVAARVCSPPGVEQNLLRVGDKVFYEKKGYFVDSTFFRLFNYPFLAGNPEHALDAPFSAVISEKLALRLFNTVEATGQSIRIGGNGGEKEFQVTGVVAPLPGKTHFNTELFMTMNSGGIGAYIRTETSWAGNNFVHGYLRLRPGADPKTLEAKLPDFLQRHGADQLRALNMHKVLALQPVRDIHTTPKLNAEISPTTSNRFLNILLLIAGIIQLIACINFMNLSTARSAHRAREVGVRKAVGAGRGALVRQFLGEGLVLTFLSVALAIPLTLLALPWFNQLTGAEVVPDLSRDWALWGIAGGLMLLTGLIAGSYPAFYLSAFRPIVVLRGIKALKGRWGDVWLRKGLVVTQFAISAALIVGALVINRQLHFMLQQDLGFERNQKVLFPFRTNESRAQLRVFRDELARLPEVQAASGLAVAPGEPVFNDMPLYKPGGDMNTSTDVHFTFTDENYLNTLKIKLLAGRFFTPADTATEREKGRVVLNETALKKFGLTPEQALGTVLRSDFQDRHFEMTVIGIMQDFHFKALSHEITPFMVVAAPHEELMQVAADVRTADYPAFFQKAGAIWQKLFPALPFEHSFLDQDFAKLYEAETTLSRIIAAFTFIAILISCLGLFGLSTFTAEQRTKEIGIRKVLGASAAGITGLLAKDFLKLVLAAIVIASPLAYFFMQKWLSEFAYRIDIQWWMFVATGGVALGIAFLTVCFQSVKAAWVNPVKSLRSE